MKERSAILIFSLVLLACAFYGVYTILSDPPEQKVKQLTKEIDAVKIETISKQMSQEKESFEASQKLFDGLNQLVSSLSQSIKAPSPKRIVYKKTGLSTGEVVWFNTSDAVFKQRYKDKRGYIFPHIISGFNLGFFIKEKDGLVWLYSIEDYDIIARQKIEIIPEQNVVLLNW